MPSFWTIFISTTMAFAAILLAHIFATQREEYHFFVEDANLDTTTYPIYEKHVLKAPILKGMGLKLFAQLLEFPLIGDFITHKLIRDNGYHKLRAFAAKIPRPFPMLYPHEFPTRENEGGGGEDENWGFPSFLTEMDKSDSLVLTLHEQFKSGVTTPVEVLNKVFTAIDESEKMTPPLKAFVHLNKKLSMQQAEESTKRFAEKKPLSVLDGIPIGVKAEFPVKGFHYTLGLAFLQSNIAKEDCLPMKKLRKAGVVFAGITNMHEIGLGTVGHNREYLSARNPFNMLYHTGGSSSGSTSAVAAGLVPFAVAADGGGSIRIPAALCGNVGLKPTFGRIPSEEEIAFSVAHAGVISRTVEDQMIALHFMSAVGDEGEFLFQQPKLQWNGILKKDDNKKEEEAKKSRSDLKGMRVGVYQEWNDDSSEEIQAATKKTIASLESLGAKVVPIQIPYLDVMFAGHTVSILSEMLTCMDRQPSANFTFPVSIKLSLAKRLDNRDYVAATIVRRWFYQKIKKIFEKVDVILTPAAGITAPAVPTLGENKNQQEEDREGIVDLIIEGSLMRFSFLGNFLGIPGLTFPVAKASKNGLPIAMQLYAKHWNEGILVKVGKAVMTKMEPQTDDRGDRLVANFAKKIFGEKIIN